MKAELSTSLALLCFGAVVHANVPIQQTAAEPGFVCNFQIQTSVVPGQPASAYRFDKLFLNGAEYGGPAANTAASLDGRGRSWCYNGTHVGEGPAAAPPSIAYGTGLKLEAFMNVKTLWNPVWATSWMVSGTPTPSKSGFWKVVLGKPIVWTQQNKNYYEIRWGGWLVCTWSQLRPQLFYYTQDLKDFKQLPDICAAVELLPVITNATQTADKPPVYKGL